MTGGGRIAGLPPLRDVIARYGLAARKSLGQHFLLDLNLTGRIARAAGDLTRGTTVEIGPGPGGLTRALLTEGATRVIAVERDRRAVEALAELVAAAEGRLTVIEGDAQTIDASALGPEPVRIVANLPYNLSTVLLVAWLKHMTEFESLTLMFQKEVADRLVATAGDAAYGRLSVLTGWVAQAERLFNIPARAFTPPPKVTSTLVRLTPRADGSSSAHDAEEIMLLEGVTAAAFGQRRKMLRQSLKPLWPDAEQLLSAADIDPTRRAETLELAEFHRLIRALRRLRAAG